MTEVAPVQVDLPFFLSRARRWMFLFLLVFAAIAGAGLLIAAALPTVYRAEALLVVESEQIPDELAQSTVQTNAAEQLQIIEKRVLSRDVLVSLADRLRIYAAEGRPGAEQMTSGDIVEDLRRRILIGPSVSRRGTTQSDALLVGIGFDSPNPDVAAAVANELVTLILEEDVATRIQLARQTQIFFQQEVARLEKDLSARSAEIQGYKEQNITSLPDSLIFRRQDLAMIEERMTQLERERRILLDQVDRIDRLTGAQTGTGAGAATAAEDGAPVQRGQLTTRDVRRSDLMTELSYLDEERDQLAVRAEALRSTIAETPRVGIRLEAMERDYQNVRSQYDLAIANLAKAEIGELIESMAKGRRISVIEQAVRPDRPFSPNRSRIALFAIAAALAGAGGLILALEMLRNVVRRPEDILAIAGDRMIMTLPHVRTRNEVMVQWAVWAAVALVGLCVVFFIWLFPAEAGRLLNGLVATARGILPARLGGGF